jgi:L-alanine-DL-glutamate epimerase-like enolase superfamily enzyme
MIIASVDVLPCVQRQEDAGWKFSRGRIAEVRGWTIRIASDCGIAGFGYGHALATVSGHAEGVKAGLDFLSPRIVGRDTRDLRGIVASLDAAIVFNPSAKAGLEMALYDLVARGLSTSVGTLLGGRMRDRIALSRLVPLKSPEEMAQKSLELAREGYRTLKLKLSGQPVLDRDRILTVRKTIGPDVKLTLDPNQAYSAKGFLSAYSGFADAGITLVEQPVPAADLPGLKLITQTLPVAVEADESAASLADVVRLARDRVVDVVNLKVAKLGGVRATLAAIEICEANGIACRFGASFGPALLQAFTAHVASLPSRLEHACELAEHLHLLDDPFTAAVVENGEMPVPAGIGTGVDLSS